MDLDGQFAVKINTVDLLKDAMKWCEIPEPSFQSVCRCLDKIQKRGWKSVKQELTELGITESTIDKLKSCIDQVADTKRYFNTDYQKPRFKDFQFASSNTTKYLSQLYDYLISLFTIQFARERIKLDLALARGLDYYTGVLFEVEINNKLGKRVGSVAAGGRYDGLCGDNTECVGFSLGLDRLLKFMKPIPKKSVAPKVLLIQTGADDLQLDEANLRLLYRYRLWVLQQLRTNNVPADTEMKLDPGFGPQLRNAIKKEIPYVMFIGPNELGGGTVSLKNLDTQEQNEMRLEEAITLITSK
jgi:histidyl-tRNA synthetase